jgi:CHASE2 domain-containing sensor protein
MKIVNILIISVVALLSIAAGLAKVMLTDQELAFLHGFGFNNALIIAFGVVQIVGGVSLVSSKTRIFGAVLVLLAFVVSTLLIFAGGNFMFGLVSMIPIALVCIIVYQSARIRNNKSTNTDASDASSG